MADLPPSPSPTLCSSLITSLWLKRIFQGTPKKKAEILDISPPTLQKTNRTKTKYPLRNSWSNQIPSEKLIHSIILQINVFQHRLLHHCRFLKIKEVLLFRQEMFVVKINHCNKRFVTSSIHIMKYIMIHCSSLLLKIWILASKI